MTADAAVPDDLPDDLPGDVRGDVRGHLPADLTVRTLRAEEWDGWYRSLEVAFGGREEEPEERQLWRGLTELDRSLAVRDGSTVVGGAGAFTFRIAVPGGAVVPAAGVTMVGVLPTHRRRGLLTAMMRRQLDDIHERGESLAVLTASEPAIYGRFGYGVGTWRMALTVPRGHLPVPPTTGAASGCGSPTR
ncbi:hypothetical protein GCM10010193_34980 [Kitasatospora atroaurantiaca]